MSLNLIFSRIKIHLVFRGVQYSSKRKSELFVAHALPRVDLRDPKKKSEIIEANS
jgi:hypothetical protein